MTHAKADRCGASFEMRHSKESGPVSLTSFSRQSSTKWHSRPIFLYTFQYTQKNRGKLEILLWHALMKNVTTKSWQKKICLKQQIQFSTVSFDNVSHELRAPFQMSTDYESLWRQKRERKKRNPTSGAVRKRNNSVTVDINDILTDELICIVEILS